jgi:hypothetical protein
MGGHLDRFMWPINTSSDFKLTNSYELIKLCESALSFIKNDKSKYDIDFLVLLQVYIQRITYEFKNHLNESKLIYFILF